MWIYHLSTKNQISFLSTLFPPTRKFLAAPPSLPNPNIKGNYTDLQWVHLGGGRLSLCTKRWDSRKTRGYTISSAYTCDMKKVTLLLWDFKKGRFGEVTLRCHGSFSPDGSSHFIPPDGPYGVCRVGGTKFKLKRKKGKEKIFLSIPSSSDLPIKRKYYEYWKL